MRLAMGLTIIFSIIAVTAYSAEKRVAACWVQYYDGSLVEKGPDLPLFKESEQIDHLVKNLEKYDYKLSFVAQDINGIRFLIRSKETGSILAEYHGRVELGEDKYQRLRYLNTQIVCRIFIDE